MVDMRTRPILLVGFLGLLGLGLICIAGPAKAGPESANACVTIRTAQLSEGLAFDLENTCEKRLSCALGWTLTCTNASGKATATAKQEARFVVAASDAHHTTGSASSCKDGWKIDDVSWDCAAVGK